MVYSQNMVRHIVQANTIGLYGGKEQHVFLFWHVESWGEISLFFSFFLESCRCPIHLPWCFPSLVRPSLTRFVVWVFILGVLKKEDEEETVAVGGSKKIEEMVLMELKEKRKWWWRWRKHPGGGLYTSRAVWFR